MVEVKAGKSMKVLSFLQPWATLVVLGLKQIETRSWSTAHRGTLLIHASKGRAGEIFAHGQPFKKSIPDFRQLPFGFIIGRVTLTDVVRIGTGNLFNTTDEMMNKLTMEEKAFGDYTAGRFAWMLEDPVVFKNPIGARGSLTLWEFEEGYIKE
ncbi:MAG: ASCH domain-containing protein [Ginsengibacter sp.]